MKAADTESTRGVLQVIEAIGLPAVLEQCAEELAELTQATLKMARALRGENPTPVTHSQAAEHLHEELGDVRLCLKVLDAAMGGDNHRRRGGGKAPALAGPHHPGTEKPRVRGAAPCNMTAK